MKNLLIFLLVGISISAFGQSKKEQIALLTSRIDSLNKEHSTLSNKYTEAQEQLQNKTKVIKEKSNTITSLNSKNKELMSEIEAIRKSQEEQIDLFTYRIDSLNKEHSTLSNQYVEAQEQLQNKSNTITSLNSKNKELMSEIEAVRKSQEEQMALLSHRLDSLNKEMIKVKEKKSSTVNVGGKEVSTIKIGNLEVMTKDLEEMEWEDAKKACADLGDGWRLPTKDELNMLYQNKDKIGGFVGWNYWTSSLKSDFYPWTQDFDNGNQSDTPNDTYGYSGVRAVRTFN